MPLKRDLTLFVTIYDHQHNTEVQIQINWALTLVLYCSQETNQIYWLQWQFIFSNSHFTALRQKGIIPSKDLFVNQLQNVQCKYASDFKWWPERRNSEELNSYFITSGETTYHSCKAVLVLQNENIYLNYSHWFFYHQFILQFTSNLSLACLSWRARRCKKTI